MKILIIGGTGVISTAVAQQAIDGGHDVTLVNRGATPARLRGSYRRITADRTDRVGFEQTVRDTGVWDCVIDMICSDPADAASLAQALRGRTGQLIFCSTTNVYPKPADAYPVREDHRLGAAFRNGIDKAQCEAIHRQAEVAGYYRLTVIRPGHTFGQGGAILHSLGQRTSFLDRVRCGRPVVIHGDGQGLWSAMHADDVAGLFVAAVGHAAALGGTFNATAPLWMTWRQYYADVAQALGVALPPIVAMPTEALVELAPQRAAQCARSLQFPAAYDMSAAQRALGFEQQAPFVDGVRRTIDWLADHDRIEPWTADTEYDAILSRWQQRTASSAWESPDLVT